MRNEAKLHLVADILILHNFFFGLHYIKHCKWMNKFYLAILNSLETFKITHLNIFKIYVVHDPEFDYLINFF